MLSVIMLSVIMLSVIMLSVIMLSVIMLSAIMLNVVLLSVVAPSYNHTFCLFLHPGGWTQTLGLGMIRRLFYHTATTTGSHPYKERFDSNALAYLKTINKGFKIFITLGANIF